MTIPTPAEITAILATLRRIPGMNDATTIGEIEYANTPEYRTTRALRRYLEEETNLDPDDIPSTRDLELALGRALAAHGLRITADPAPGELIQYRLVRQAANGHVMHDASVSYVPDQGGLNAAREDCAKYADPKGCCPRIAAVYLLPEGGQQ